MGHRTASTTVDEKAFLFSKCSLICVERVGGDQAANSSPSPKACPFEAMWVDVLSTSALGKAVVAKQRAPASSSSGNTSFLITKKVRGCFVLQEISVSITEARV